VTEIRSEKGTLFNKNVSFEVSVLCDFAKLETEMTVLKMIDLLRKKDFSDFRSSDFGDFDIISTGPGDRKCINIQWENPLSESEVKQMKSIDLYHDSISDQIGSSKVSFESNSLSSINIECTNGYKETIKL